MYKPPTKLKPWHINVLTFICLLNIALFYFVPLNLLDGDNDWLDGIGFVLLWPVVFYKRLHSDDYISKQIKKVQIHEYWKTGIIAVILLSILFYFFEGSLWKGLFLGVLIFLGIFMNNWITHIFIKHVLKDK